MTKISAASLAKLLKGHPVKKVPFPESIAPMLATKVSKPFDNPNFIYEIKWDGYRILGYKNKNGIKLRSRGGQDYTKIYDTVTNSLKTLEVSIVLDGEVVLLDDDGKPSFDDLQNVRSLGTERLMYCIFDVLWVEGYSLLDVPLLQRKKILEQVVPESFGNAGRFEYRTEGLALYKEMQQAGMEGIVAKEINSQYKPGERVDTWLKVTTKKRQEFVIGGWTESASGRLFRSLLFGYYDNTGKLICYGHSGGGYTDKNAAHIKSLLDKIGTAKKPFANEVETDTKAHWVKPIYVAEFEYATTTKSGKIRKPAIFKGLRSDKNPKDVRLETTRVTDEVLATEPVNKSDFVSQDSNWPELRKSLKRGSKNELEIEGHKVTLNNIEEIIWPSEEVTKADLIKYYIEVAPYLLPHVKNRPLSLHIKHKGVFEPGMYIKGMEGNQPKWADTFIVDRKHKTAKKSEKIDYLICNNTATLVYMINLGCIDVNPTNSTTQHYENPDYLVIDLDPTGGPFEQVVEAAKVTKKVLDKLKLTAFVKTSGKTGVHILVPVQPVFTFKQARSIVGKICEMVHQQIPDISTIEDEISRRGSKVFLDDNQNDLADTIACAYSVRPYHFPSVSTPLEWREINSRLNPLDFNIFSTINRLRKLGDLHNGILQKRNRMQNMASLKMFR